MNAPLPSLTALQADARPSELLDPVFGKLAYVPQVGPRAAHWRGVAHLSPSATSVQLVIDTAAARPTEGQQSFWLQFVDRRPFFFAAALVVLKPAFAHYVGHQDTLRTMISEFPLVTVRIPAVIDANFDADTGWSQTFGCTTRPELRFEVRFSGSRAVHVLVDCT